MHEPQKVDSIKPEYIPFKCPNCLGHTTVNYGKFTCPTCKGLGFIKVPVEDDDYGKRTNK
jgi:phage FluMu protein Com